jgi:hypothetical protein
MYKLQTIKAFKTIMSRTMNNHNSANSKGTSFCKVCQDAGKLEIDYTSHYVKSPPDKRTGICYVICPTLLSTECRYCHKLGHTAKFCTVLETRKKSDQHFVRQQQRDTVEKPIEKAVSRNIRGGFSVLLDIDDDVKKMPTKEEFPALCKPSKRVSIIPNYALALASYKPIPVRIAAKTQVKKISWADSDSDEEDETYEDEKYEDQPYEDNSAW